MTARGCGFPGWKIDQGWLITKASSHIRVSEIASVALPYDPATDHWDVCWGKPNYRRIRVSQVVLVSMKSGQTHAFGFTRVPRTQAVGWLEKLMARIKKESAG